MTAPISLVLERLEKVKQRQAGQWSARCPAHADKGPSLSVRETPDGAVLLYCFAGCPTENIIGALGLSMASLFPPLDRPPGAPSKTPRLLTASQALEMLDKEAQIIALAGKTIANGGHLAAADADRVMKAAGRVLWIRGEFMGGSHG